MNKTQFTLRYEWAKLSYPQIRYAAGIPLLRDSDEKTVCTNAQAVYQSDLFRYWLYYDLLEAAPDRKVREWFLTYTRIDFVQYNDALEAVYELCRRDQLQLLTVSQFKAAIKEFGITPNVLLGPTWPELERLLLDHKSGPLPIGFVQRVVQWTRLSARITLDNPSLVEECAERFQANQDRLHDLWSEDDSVRDTYVRYMKRIIQAWIPDASFCPLPGRHGSGAVAEESAKRLASRKSPYLGQTDQLLEAMLRRFDVDARDDISPSLNLRRGPLSRVSRWLTVPKSIRKRRGIAPQPACLQFYQQGVLKGMYAAIWHPLPTVRKLRKAEFERARFIRDHFPIFNRDVNREAALRGSRYNHWSTYDLQDASDSISVRLVKGVFGPNLRLCLISCRCKRTSDHDRMETYGTMGDATVFPTETIVIGAAVQLALILAREHDDTVHLRQFLVFGDDICVQNNPTVHHYIHEVFSRLGFKINDEKSFLSGNYRESCGVEAYCGYEIQPMYFLNRATWPVNRANQIASLIAIANNAFERGFRACRMYSIHMLQRLCWASNLVPFTTHSLDSAKVYTPFLTDRGIYRRQVGESYQEVQRYMITVTSTESAENADETWEQWYRYYMYLAYPPARVRIPFTGCVINSEQDCLWESDPRSFLNRLMHIRKRWVDVATLE